AKGGPHYIAWKPKDKLNLNPQELQKIFPTGRVFGITVLLDRKAAATQELSVVQQAEQAIHHLNQNPPPPKKSAFKEFTPSKYQNTIGDKLVQTTKHLFIEALAGCGKTGTLIWLVRKLKEKGLTLNKAIVYLAFNTAIKDELVDKLEGTGVPALTTHSFC